MMDVHIFISAHNTGGSLVIFASSSDPVMDRIVTYARVPVKHYISNHTQAWQLSMAPDNT